MKNRKKWIERGILAVIFVVAVVIFSFLTNRGDENTTAGLDGASCPQVSFSAVGYDINHLNGYVKEVDVSTIRDTITPVIRGQVTANIHTDDMQISGITYGVYSLDGKEKLYEERISDISEEVIFEFSKDGLLDEERLLKITLHAGEEKDIHYYTRIMDATDANLKVCLDYAKDFHTNALMKMEDQGIESAIETQAQGNSGAFRNITIHSDFDHVTWGKLEPQVEDNIRWNVKELKNSYTCLELEYQVACVGEENEQDEYKIEEFFKIRHSDKAKKTYLLEYDRIMEQIFDPIGQVLGSKGVILGIVDENISYKTNKDGTIVSFVQADELWSYNKETNDITLVFSFDAEEGYDERNLIRKHEIEILNHGNSGDIRFAVKGYMNRGDHEGEVGIVVYYYEAKEQTVIEEAFVSYDNALESQVFFHSGLNILYVLTEGDFYEFKLDYRSQDVIAEGLAEGEYQISPAGNQIAYIDKSGEPASKIVLRNLKKEEVQEITGQDGEVLIPLGFIENDFIYGVARQEDAGKNISGKDVLPMYKIEILNTDGETEMSYEKNGKYLLSVSIEDNMITVVLANKKGNVYTEDREDFITNNSSETKGEIYSETYVTELKEKQVRLTFDKGLEEEEPKFLRANQTMSDKTISFVIEGYQTDKGYQVYAYGQLYGKYRSLGEAVNVAKEHTGVVLDENQKCIWEMSNRDLNYMISADNTMIPVLLDNLDDGMLPAEAAHALSDVTCEDLTGCKTEDLLYILNQDIPVIAMTNPKEAVVLVGYNEIDVFYKIPGSDEKKNVSYEEMDEMTKKSGHTYIGVK